MISWGIFKEDPVLEEEEKDLSLSDPETGTNQWVLDTMVADLTHQMHIRWRGEGDLFDSWISPSVRSICRSLADLPVRYGVLLDLFVEGCNC